MTIDRVHSGEVMLKDWGN